MKTWLISDTHFGHANILTFKKYNGELLRPGFKDVDHMDWSMVANWNKVVAPEDKVYHLGDLSICRWSHLNMILSALNGRKVLIKGNHDKLKLSQYAQHFYDVRGYHVLDGILLAHIPVHPECLGRWRGQVHGHLHSNLIGQYHDVGRSVNAVYVPDYRYFNVSVEQINYTPIDWEEVKKHFDTHDRHREHNLE
jgi:calcineurin-like phosphoesterase family protein